MKILIDIGHPAHVHYFKNFIKIMESKGNDLLIVARDRDIIFNLLESYNIDYISRGEGGWSIISKIFYILIADFNILKHTLDFCPDIFLSFGSPYAGHISFIFNKPHIAIDDTEHAIFEHTMYRPFASTILTPVCFNKNFGKKQIKFNSYMELSYLHPDYFIPNREVLNYLNIDLNQKYAIVRFISWDANHDIGQSGLSYNEKIDLIEFLSEKMQVFISSEEKLPKKLSRYAFNLPPALFHDALAFADLYIGEGGTTASEAAMLGIPTIYINSLLMGYLEDAISAGIIYHFKEFDGVIDKVNDIFELYNYSKIFKKRRKKFIKEKIIPTDFFVWFVENYPESFYIMEKNPEYQNKFRSNV